MNTAALAITIHMVGITAITFHSVTHNRDWPLKSRLALQLAHIGLWTVAVAAGSALVVIGPTNIGAGILSLLGL